MRLGKRLGEYISRLWHGMAWALSLHMGGFLGLEKKGGAGKGETGQEK